MFKGNFVAVVLTAFSAFILQAPIKYSHFLQTRARFVKKAPHQYAVLPCKGTGTKFGIINTI